MKTRHHSLHAVRRSWFSNVALGALLFAVTLPAQAQNAFVSAPEFQRMVYSANLHSELTLKPDLEAGLQVLLEAHRRNPQADPLALVNSVTNALQLYRASGPHYVRTNGSRDEILAGYLDAFRQVQKPANFVQINLAMLNNFMLGPDDYSMAVSNGYKAGNLIYYLADWGQHHVFSTRNATVKRQTLADDCVARAQGQNDFAAALDRLLLPETGVAVAHTPAQIIGNSASPLHDNFTMTNLLALSQASGDGSLTVSSNLVINWFTNQMQTFWDICHTNLAVLRQINQSRSDLLAYLTNRTAINDNDKLIAEVHDGQPARLASATAAVLIQSKLLDIADPQTTKADQAIAAASAGIDVGAGIASLLAGDPGGLVDIKQGVLSLFDMFSGRKSHQEQVEDEMVNQIKNTQILIQDLSQNVDYRFDRVDQSLTTIFNSLNGLFANIEYQGQRIAQLNRSVDAIRASLANVQTSIDRLEETVTVYAQTQERDELISPANDKLFYTLQNRGKTLDWNGYVQGASAFVNFTIGPASGDILSRHTFSPGDFSGTVAQQRLTTNSLNANLNYVKQFLAQLGQTTGGSTDPMAPHLSNPRDWFAGAYALMQLDEENPMLFRQKDPGDVIAARARGYHLTNFFGSLSFGANGINSNLYAALENWYFTNLVSLNTQVLAAERFSATNTHNFDLDTWRNWDLDAPRMTATNSALLLSVPRRLIAAGADHSLAVRPDGTIVGWGNNSHGETTIPVGLRNVVAVGAGTWHSVALKADGTVVSWGNNSYGQTGVPVGLNDVVAVSASGFHQLALKKDGTVVGWGHNGAGQVSIPVGLNNVVAIAGGGAFSLALKGDGTVVGWGWNAEGEATGVNNGPPGPVIINGVPLTGVVAIDAGEYHSLALKADGTVVSWGMGTFVATPSDGFNYGQAMVPAGLTNVAAIEAGGYHSLARKTDGTFVAWGAGDPTTGGSALSFNGTTSYVEFNRPVQDDFTIEFWFRSTQVAGSESGWWQGMGLVDGEVANTVNDFGVSFGNGKVLFGVGNPNVTIRSTTSLADGQWHHVAATRQKTGGAMILFVDGVQHATATGNQNSLVSPAKLRLGSIQTGINFFRGQIDEVRIWNKVRNQSDIRANMNVSLTGAEPNLAVYYRLNEGTGSVAQDATANHLDATLNGGATWVNSPLPQWGQATPPASLGDVASMAAGGAHSLALKADGSIVGWGCNTAGQVPRGWLATPRVRNHIAAGSYHSAVLRADSTVVAWGRSDLHQLDTGGWSNVVAIAGDSTGEYTLALKTDGRVVACGDNSYGQCNVGGWNNIVDIAPGNYHALGLRADGTVVACGNNDNGQCNVGGWNRVVAVAAGGQFSGFVVRSHSLGLRADGTVVACGDNTYGQCNVGGWDDVVAIAAGSLHSIGLRADGTVVGTGSNGAGQINTGGWSNVVAIAAGHQFSLGLRADGTVAYCGSVIVGVIDTSGWRDVVAVAGGQLHALGLKADGSVIASGVNQFGCLNVPATAVDLAAWGECGAGLGGVPAVSSPMIAVAAGSAHSVALTADGSAIAWGLNTWGQTNVPPEARSGVQAVAAGLGHNLALLSNGSVAAWGLNDRDQATVPSGLNGVAAISAGAKHNLALTTNGVVIPWGLDDYDQVSPVPALAGGQPLQGNVVAVSAGGEHSLALTGNGMVVGWGANFCGQTTVPSQALAKVVAIAAGRYHSLALTSAGRVLAWGLNSGGQCTVPTAAHSGVVAIAAGRTHSAALKTNGVVVVWGSGPAAFTPPQTWNNGVALALGDQHSVVLTANPAAGLSGSQGLSLVSAQIPSRLAWVFAAINHDVANEAAYGGPLYPACVELAGYKALLAAVVQLGMPYTLQRDGILHGFLYGRESLLDLGTVPLALQDMSSRLLAAPQARPQLFGEVATLRFQRFADRLDQCLTDLNEPEIPRLVGHTVRLLNVLCEASVWATNSPPPTLEIGTLNGAPSLWLYGEPYVHYTLQYRDSLSAPGWTTTTMTNLLNEQPFPPPTAAGPQRFYRLMLPIP